VFIVPLPPRFNEDPLHACVRSLPLGSLHSPVTTGLGEAFHLSDVHHRQTGQFSAEPLFHFRLATSPLRVYSYEEADLVWVPVFFGLYKGCVERENPALINEFFSLVSARNATEPSERFLPHLERLPHVVVLGRIEMDFGRMLRAVGEPVTRFYYLSIEPAQIKSSFAIPYPTQVHFSPAWRLPSVLDPAVVSATKTVLVSAMFSPVKKRPLRQKLIEQCLADAERCRFVNVTRGALATLQRIAAVRHAFQYALRPDDSAVSFAGRFAISDRDDAFTMSIKQLLRVMCDPQRTTSLRLPGIGAHRCLA
jgi:hypothetical protein